MPTSESDLLFLQQLYAHDTLYVIPEQINHEAVSLPVAGKVTPSLPQAEKVEAPVLSPAPISIKEEAVAAPIVIQTDEIQWLGEAVQGTYLLFEAPDAVFRQLPNHVFLQKVLTAVGLSTGQIKFGNMSPEVVHDVKEIAAKNQARHIILFGKGLPVANLSRMEFYRMYKFGESRFVLVDSLEDIEQSMELKKKLWDVLQKIFLQQN